MQVSLAAAHTHIESDFSSCWYLRDIIDPPKSRQPIKKILDVLT